MCVRMHACMYVRMYAPGLIGEVDGSVCVYVCCMHVCMYVRMYAPGLIGEVDGSAAGESGASVGGGEGEWAQMVLHQGGLRRHVHGRAW